MSPAALRPVTDPLSVQWIQHCREVDRTPPNTLLRRESVLRSIGNAGTATREDVEAWWASRAHLSPATRSNDLANLRAFVCLGAYGGLRVSEAAALTWHDVDLENRRVRVLGKGGKTRLVGLSPLLLDELLPDTGGNVVAAGGAPYSAAALQRKVNRAIRAAGVDCTYHQLRHRFGTVALAATGNLLAVSRAMGHASPATTAIYAATSDADLDVIADAVTR